MARDSRGLVGWRAMGAALLFAMLVGRPGIGAARAAAPVSAAHPRRPSHPSDNAVAAELDGQWVILLSESEIESRQAAADRRAAELAAKAQAAAPAPAQEDDEEDVPSARARPASRGRRRRRSGSPLYRQERMDGQTYRQKYSSWSCSAASLTIALSLLEKKPANETTEELVISKLGSNISHKDGLTGHGMQALADVARQDFKVAARRIESTDDVASELKAGHVVVLDVRRPISGSGHYVVVSGPGHRAGTLHIKDPARDGGDFEWDRDTLKSAIRAGGVAVWNN